MKADLETLAAAKPTPRFLVSEVVSAAQRQELMEAIIATPAQLITGYEGMRALPRKWLGRKAVATAFVATMATALAVAEVLLPSTAPGGSQQAAAAIQQLATKAANSAANPLEPGRYLHLVDRVVQGADVVVLESWISYDGYVWRHDTDEGSSQYYVLSPTPGVDIADPSPEFLSTLPTNPSTLRDYLGQRVTGSSDGTVFRDVGDLLRGGDAPTALRVALFSVLEDTADVKADKTLDSLGRIAVRLTFTDPTGQAGVESLLFDPATAALLEEQDGPDFTATYTSARTVGSVPPKVLALAGPRPPIAAPPTVSAQPTSSAAPTTER